MIRLMKGKLDIGAGRKMRDASNSNMLNLHRYEKTKILLGLLTLQRPEDDKTGTE